MKSNQSNPSHEFSILLVTNQSTPSTGSGYDLGDRDKYTINGISGWIEYWWAWMSYSVWSEVSY